MARESYQGRDRMVEQKVLFSSLKTPAVLVDMDKLEANIREMSKLAVEAGVKLRPHTKVHGSVAIAKMQLAKTMRT